ncbi:MAG: endolytic transglycosylase MltG [Clostridium sp.]|jgi:UPF0755 protein|nr:endolytic transglycosylase MltG [Clostridium sp.]
MKIRHIVSAVCGAILKLATLIILGMTLYRGAIMAYDYGYRVFTEPAVALGEGRNVTVAITADMTAMEIGKMFADKGLVRDANLFVAQYLLSEYRADTGPGIYELNTSMTAEEIMEAMAKAFLEAAKRKEAEAAETGSAQIQDGETNAAGREDGGEAAAKGEEAGSEDTRDNGSDTGAGNEYAGENPE